MAAACGGDLNHGAVTDTTGGEVVGRTADAAAIQSFAATLSEWSVQAPTDTVVAGRYQFLAANAGRYTHALEVEGNEAEVETAHIAPRASAQVTVDLRPGIYELYCPIEDSLGVHKDRGMTRTLVVRAP
jgi:uncharacterized cupredoxin-like copper-binding protein